MAIAQHRLAWLYANCGFPAAFRSCIAGVHSQPPFRCRRCRPRGTGLVPHVGQSIAEGGKLVGRQAGDAAAVIVDVARRRADVARGGRRQSRRVAPVLVMNGCSAAGGYEHIARRPVAQHGCEAAEAAVGA